jgi:hypothetical protein
VSLCLFELKTWVIDAPLESVTGAARGEGNDDACRDGGAYHNDFD